MQNLSKKFMRQVGIKFINKRDSKAKKRKSRTSQTISNKIDKLKAIYNRLIKVSLKSKKYYEVQDEAYRKLHKIYGRQFFCDVYPTYEDFVKNYNLKGIK